MEMNECHIISSDMGTGKSEVMDNLLNQYDKVLIVSSRKIFTECMLQRFGDL